MYRSYASVFRPYMSALMPLRLKTKAAMEPGSAAVKLRASTSTSLYSPLRSMSRAFIDTSIISLSSPAPNMLSTPLQPRSIVPVSYGYEQSICTRSGSRMMPLSAKAFRCLWLMMLVDHQLRSAQFCSHHAGELLGGSDHSCELALGGSCGGSCCGVSRAVLSGFGRRARFLKTWRCCCDGHLSQAGSSWCALSPSQTFSSPSHGLHGCCTLSVRSKLWTMTPARVNELSG